MLLSLLGGGLGGLLRFVPEIFKLINAKSDQKHELEMSKLQLEIDDKRSKQQLDLVHAQSDSAEIAGNMAAFAEAIKGQSQLTGVKWVDAINATVRPFVTYWFMAIFSVYKATVVYSAWYASISVTDFGSRIWNENDTGMLSMILTFWFVDRVFRKHAGQ